MPVHIYQPLKQSEDDSDMESEGGESAFRTPSHLRTSANVPHILDERMQEELERERDAHAGVQRVEAAKKVYGRSSKWILFISLGMASYIYSLDSSTTSNYLSFAASAFGAHALISSVQVAQSVIIAVGKPVIAKIADVTSRAYAYLGVLIFYVIGYIVIGSAGSIGTVATGIIIYAVGLQLLTQIIIADLTTLKWRALVSSLTSLPFVLNGFIGPLIATFFLEKSSWRWGYAMFAILVPLTLLPLIITLFWAERKAKRLGLVTDTFPEEATTLALVPLSTRTFSERVRHAAEQLDLIGLILLGGSIALILLPLTLAKKAEGGWKNASIIAMLVVGVTLIILFAGWDLCHASRPVIAPRFIRNRSIVIASLIGFFDFFSYFLTYVYLFSFVLVVKPWNTLEATYFVQIQTIALTSAGLLSGLLMWYARRYKLILIGGLCIRLLGCGLMIHSRGANGSTVEIVWTQILQGFGGGFAAVANQVGAQASIPHTDVAMVTAILLLLTEIGGAVGSAIAGAMWSSAMPRNLAKALPHISEELRAELFASITDVLKYPRGDPIREGVITAYDSTMKTMVVAATILSVVPIFLSLWMPSFYLGDTQNAVDNAALDGELHEEHENDVS